MSNETKKKKKILERFLKTFGIGGDFWLKMAVH